MFHKLHLKIYNSVKVLFFKKCFFLSYEGLNLAFVLAWKCLKPYENASKNILNKNNLVRTEKTS